MTSQSTASTRRDILRAAWLLGAGAAVGGVSVPRLVGTGTAARAHVADADPTQTREAEIEELRALQTEVAEPPVCTPAPTQTPAPTETPVPATATATPVPPVAAGQEIAYSADLALTAVSIAPVPSGGELRADGQFVRVNLIARNTSVETVELPIGDLRLTDAAGRPADVDVQASLEIAGGRLSIPIGVGNTEERSIVFDVAADAGPAFILESTEAPTFRVALAVESRG